jgi:hypothetical protein
MPDNGDGAGLFRIVGRAPSRSVPFCPLWDRADVTTPSVIASEAKQSILSSCFNMDCFASLAMTEEHTLAFSRHDLPEVCKEVVLPLKDRATVLEVAR